MGKDAFDMLVKTVNESNRVILKLATQVSAHAVWIKIFSCILLAVIGGLITLWMKRL